MKMMEMMCADKGGDKPKEDKGGDKPKEDDHAGHDHDDHAGHDHAKPTEAPKPTKFKSTGSTTVKMSKDHAKELVKDVSKAKKVFASAIAKSGGFATSEVTITDIIHDGKSVMSGRRLEASSLEVKFEVVSEKKTDDLKAQTGLADAVVTAAKDQGITVEVTTAEIQVSAPVPAPAPAPAPAGDTAVSGSSGAAVGMIVTTMAVWGILSVM